MYVYAHMATYCCYTSPFRNGLDCCWCVWQQCWQAGNKRVFNVAENKAILTHVGNQMDTCNHWLCSGHFQYTVGCPPSHGVILWGELTAFPTNRSEGWWQGPHLTELKLQMAARRYYVPWGMFTNSPPHGKHSTESTHHPTGWLLVFSETLTESTWG